MSNIKPQNATWGDGLSPAQEKALAALLAGQTVTTAASVAGVDRTTIYRWLRHPDHPAFRKGLEEGRRELRQAMSQRLEAMLPMAAGCLEAALMAGETKCALTLLKGLGFLPGSTRAE